MADGPDPHHLARFVAAQDAVLEAVRSELAAGRKTSHWMWFVFPQLRALGQSTTALHYGISGLTEARAYLAHPVLGPRLVDCAQLVLAAHAVSAVAIFGTIDAMKLRSCMTLFSGLPDAPPVFDHVLARFFAGEPDPRTLALLGTG